MASPGQASASWARPPCARGGPGLQRALAEGAAAGSVPQAFRAGAPAAALRAPGSGGGASAGRPGAGAAAATLGLGLLRSARRGRRQRRAPAATAAAAKPPWRRRGKEAAEEPAPEPPAEEGSGDAQAASPPPSEEEPAASGAEAAAPSVEGSEGPESGSKPDAGAAPEGETSEAAKAEEAFQAPELSCWSTVEGVAVLRPPAWVPVRGVVHFIGGAFVGAAPQWSYRGFLTALSARGIWVFATPLPTSFDHLQLVSTASESFERAYGRVVAEGLVDASLPVFGVGHSMGALLTALTGCGEGVPEEYSKRLKGQVMISYNSQSLAGAVPLWRELWTREEFRPSIGEFAERLDALGNAGVGEVASTALDVAGRLAKAAGLEGGAALLGGSERVRELYAPALEQLPPLFRDVAKGVSDFAPASAELSQRLRAAYPGQLPALLVKFKGDPIDQTRELERLLKGREGQGPLSLEELRGLHVSPNFSEPPDLIDGTDALGRAALGSETPVDSALLRAGADLSALVEAVDSFIEEKSQAEAPAEEKPSAAADEGEAPPPTEGEEQAPGLRLKGLSADDFRHPLDKRQTRALERIPGLGALVRRVASLVEFAVYQDNVSSSVLVGEKQYAWLYALLCEACEILNIPEAQRPEVYVRQNPIPNAYTLAVKGKRPFIVVHTALLDLCCPAETQAVLAHELGHLKCEHGTWLSAANILLLGASTLPLPARVLEPLLERVQEDLGTWQRAAELSCDRAALLVAQEPWTPLSVLVKLSGGGTARGGGDVLPRERLEAFLAQAKRFDDSRAEANMLEEMLASALRGGRPRTHPIPVLRARELRRWADSEQFAKLLRERGVPTEASAK